MYNRGRWIKITNLEIQKIDNGVESEAKRKDRITQDFKLAPFYETRMKIMYELKYMI